MADNDDPTQTSKKRSLKDMMRMTPGTAPELKGAPSEPEEVDTSEPEAEIDKAIDDAVEDIMKKDGDEVLKVQDEKAEKAVVMKTGLGERLKNTWAEWWVSPRKRWSTVGVVVVALAAVFGVPYTRYNALGLVLKADVTVQAIDSKTGEPVSGATVKVGTKTAQTDAKGNAVLSVHMGTRTVQASKTYYTGSTQHDLVTISAKQNTFKVKLVALGRQVKVKLVSKITGKPIAGVSVAVGTSTAKTDADGMATLVIPSGASTQEASVSLDGYNAAKVSITAAGDLAKNTFGITPVGKLYFLSNLSGKLDVVKANLDGTSREVVLEGTGTEDKYSTSLLASRDWKYLALLSKRAGSNNASLYLIDTTNGDKLTTIDEGDSDFTLVGWNGDNFVYQVSHHVPNGQKNAQALKSFDPTTGHTLLLDQTDGATYSFNMGSSTDPDNDPNSAYYTGYGTNGYTKQSFGTVYLLGDSVVYAKTWVGNGFRWIKGVGLVSYVNGKSAELDTIGVDGSGHKTIKTFAPSGAIHESSENSTDYIGVNSNLYEPQGIYLSFTDGSTTTFYEYENGKVSDAADLTNDTFYQNPYSTYLLSPSGSSTFWSEQRDGKNTLLTGNANGKNAKQVANLSEYNTYGWFTDDYLLVSKSSSELYIMPTAGGTPFKITDYYKPAISYEGYGGGYGGL